MNLYTDSESPAQTMDEQFDLGLHSPHILKDTLLHGAAYFHILVFSLVMLNELKSHDHF